MSSDVLARPRAAARVEATPTDTSPEAGRGRAGWRQAAFLLTYPVAAIALLVASGPLWPVPAALTVLAGCGWVVWGVRRRRRRENRGHIEVTVGSRWPWRPAGWLERRQAWRDLRRIEREWEFIATAGGVPGAKLLTASCGLDSYALHISAPGRVLEDVDVARLHSAMQLHDRFEVIVPDPLCRPWELVVRSMQELEAGPEEEP